MCSHEEPATKPTAVVVLEVLTVVFESNMDKIPPPPRAHPYNIARTPPPLKQKTPTTSHHRTDEDVIPFPYPPISLSSQTFVIKDSCETYCYRFTPHTGSTIVNLSLAKENEYTYYVRPGVCLLVIGVTHVTGAKPHILRPPIPP